MRHTAIILKSAADVVAQPEVNGPEFLASLLAYLNDADGDDDVDFYGVAEGSTATVSKFELFDMADNGAAGGARAVVDLDRTGDVSAGDFLFDGIHANYTDYANYLPRGYYPGTDYGRYAGLGWGPTGPDGQPLPITDLDEIAAINAASGRTEALRQVADVHAEAYGGLSSIVAGDFNEASHLDWTEDAARRFDHNGVVYEWDTSKALTEAGYVDSFREINPDEVANPGFTWVTGVETGDYTLTWTPLADERDRIDFVYHREGHGQQVELVASEVFGTDRVYVRGEVTEPGSGDDRAFDVGEPWFTDHNGVLTRYAITAPDAAPRPDAVPGRLFTAAAGGGVAAGDGDDVQIGGAGWNLLAGSWGADAMVGGAGTDTAD